MKYYSTLILSLFLVSACDTASGPGADQSDDRGPIGKADVFGSCDDACGEMAKDGNCWCDFECASIGDCCEDATDVCEEDGAEVCGGIGNLGCPDGQTCLDDPNDDCNLGEGADCSGLCVPDEEPTYVCGGIGGLACPDGLTCIDDPSDDCNADGADCGGICVPADDDDDDDTTFCGGFGNLACPDGLMCVDDPNDDCDLEDGADCGGICV